MREPGAIPGRSRRCKGSCSPTETPLARRETGCREGGGRGSPESEDLPPPPYRTPRGRRIRGTTSDRSRDRSRSRSRARRYGSRRHRHGARRRKDPADLRIGARQGATPRTRSSRSTRRARSESSTSGSPTARSGRTSARSAAIPAAGSAGWVFKVNGASPPVGADQVVLKDGDEVLWYYATFGATGGPKTLSLKAAAANCYTVSAFDDAGKSTPAAGAQVQADGRQVQGRRERPGLRRQARRVSCGRTPSAPSGRTP